MIKKMEVLAGVGGFEVVLPEMRKSTALGWALERTPVKRGGKCRFVCHDDTHFDTE